jgi:ribonuclease BN (tRNA processing enzyme)
MPDVVFLGTNGWFDTETGATVCALVKAREAQVVLDAGNGIHSLGAHVDPSRRVHLFLSHFHLDHVEGLHTLCMNRLEAGLTFIVGDGSRAHLDALMRDPFMVARDRLPFPTSVVEAPSDAARLPFRAEFLPLRHSAPSLGIRMELDGALIAYCLDTAYCENAVRLCAGADLAILECTLPSGTPSESHLSPESCARIAREAGVKRLALTHFEGLGYPTLASRKAALRAVKRLFPRCALAADGMRIRL